MIKNLFLKRCRQFWFEGGIKKLKAADKQTLVKQFTEDLASPGVAEKLKTLLSVCSKRDLGKQLLHDLTEKCAAVKTDPHIIETGLITTVESLPEARVSVSWQRKKQNPNL